MAKPKEIKKKWVQVFSTQEFGNVEIGEIPYSEIKNTMGKILRINLYLLTNDSRKQNSEIAFRIINADEKKANTEIVDYRMLNAYLKRIIKKEKNKIDDSFTCETKDKVKIRVKPMMITKNKTKQSNLNRLRTHTREIFRDYSKSVDFGLIIKDLVNNSIQRNIKQELKKVYPLNLFEIRDLSRIK